MPTMNISVTNELIEMVNGKVNSGLYGDASEVINAALRLMDEYDQSQHFTIRQIEQKLGRGLQQAEKGEFTEQSVGDIVAEAKAFKLANRSSAT